MSGAVVQLTVTERSSDALMTPPETSDDTSGTGGAPNLAFCSCSRPDSPARQAEVARPTAPPSAARNVRRPRPPDCSGAMGDHFAHRSAGIVDAHLAVGAAQLDRARAEDRVDRAVAVRH